MEGKAVIDFFKKAAKGLAVGTAGAIANSQGVRVVPAIAPIPVSEVDTSYGQANVIERPPKDAKEEYEEVVLETIKTVAQQRNLPYEKKPEVSLKEGAITKRRTVAEIGEGGEPEAIIPLSKYGKSIEAVYKEGASLLISSSMGFLQTLPASPARASVLSEANRLKTVFGISDTPKPAFKIGLKQKLENFSTGVAAGTQPSMKAPEQTKKSGDKKKSGGNILQSLGKTFNKFRNFRKSRMGRKAKVFLSRKGRKAGKALGKMGKLGKGLGKIGKSAGKLMKGGKTLANVGTKAGKALLKKGAKKIAAKVGGKAIAKVGAKALGKGLLKKIPFVGMGAGLLFAGQRLMKGDFKGAMLEAASGIASTIPGVGTAVSIGLDATLAAKDMGVLPGQKQAEDQQSGLQAPDPKKDMYGRPIVLNPPTMKAWIRAVNAAAKDGINLPMSVTSSYRSPEQQQALVDAAEAGDKNVISPAQPGNSPHGQGWAVDIDYASKANEWMRDKGKKFGFEWQGEKDPVHFDFLNNDQNNKWLQPGKNKWIPNIDDPVGDPSSGEQKSGGSPQKGDTSSITAPGTMPESVSTLNNEPVTQGVTNVAGNVIPDPRVVPVKQQPQIITVPYDMQGAEREEYIQNSLTLIDPYGKGVKYEVWDEF